MKNVKNKNDHSFCVRAPYLYPLYKIHKLNKQQIEDKVKPPNRMSPHQLMAQHTAWEFSLSLFFNQLLLRTVKES